jgi:hypothetical protein
MFGVLVVVLCPDRVADLGSLPNTRDKDELRCLVTQKRVTPIVLYLRHAHL